MPNKMKPMQAWKIISANLSKLYKLRRTKNYKGYNDDDIQAEIACFIALKELEKAQYLIKSLKGGSE
jgi:hypothetical protein